MSSLVLVSPCAGFAHVGARPLPRDFDFTPERQCRRPPVVRRGARLRLRTRRAQRFSVRVPEGNYRVTLRFGGSRDRDICACWPSSAASMVEARLSATRARAQLRRERTHARLCRRCPRMPPVAQRSRSSRARSAARPGTTSSRSKFCRAMRIAAIDLRSSPSTCPRSISRAIRPSPIRAVAPNASWGQMLPRFFAPDIAVANHAESGETLKSFVTELRLDKLLSTLQRRRLGDDPVRAQRSEDRSGRRPTPKPRLPTAPGCAPTSPRCAAAAPRRSS